MSKTISQEVYVEERDRAPLRRSNGRAGFLILGLLSLVGAAFAFSNMQSFVGTALSTEGHVVSEESAGRGTYSPVVQFETRRRVSVTATCKYASNPPNHKVGDAVRVLYSPANPENIHLDEFLDLWMLSAVPAAFGSVFIYAALFGGEQMSDAEVMEWRQSAIARIRALLSKKMSLRDSAS